VVGTPSATYGAFAVNASTGVWTYTLVNSQDATQALMEGDVVTQTYTVRALDDQGALVDQTVTITINGTNDVPVVSNRVAATAGAVSLANVTAAGGGGLVSVAGKAGWAFGQGVLRIAGWEAGGVRQVR
jgi:VCBS repeat-containing protein